MQFAYGEDGLDVTQTAMMRQFGFLARNAPRFAQQVRAPPHAPLVFQHFLRSAQLAYASVQR